MIQILHYLKIFLLMGNAGFMPQNYFSEETEKFMNMFCSQFAALMVMAPQIGDFRSNIGAYRITNARLVLVYRVPY